MITNLFVMNSLLTIVCVCVCCFSFHFMTLHDHCGSRPNIGKENALSKWKNHVQCGLARIYCRRQHSQRPKQQKLNQLIWAKINYQFIKACTKNFIE